MLKPVCEYESPKLTQIAGFVACAVTELAIASVRAKDASILGGTTRPGRLDDGGRRWTQLQGAELFVVLI